MPLERKDEDVVAPGNSKRRRKLEEEDRDRVQESSRAVTAAGQNAGTESCDRLGKVRGVKWVK